MLTLANGLLLRTASLLTIVLMVVLVATVSANVFARYVLGSGILWAEEMSRLAFVWSVFLGAYIALSRGSHMAIGLVVDRLAPAARRAVAIVGQGFVLAFLLVVCWTGARLVLATYGFGRVTPILGISAAWAYLSVPVAAALMALRVAETLVSLLKGMPSSEGREVSS